MERRSTQHLWRWASQRLRIRDLGAFDPEPQQHQDTCDFVDAVNTASHVLQRLLPVLARHHHGSRIALVGPNGAGKSTLLKLIQNELEPTHGQLRRHLDLKLGKYHQHSTDQLDPEKCVLDFMIESFPKIKMEVEDWRKSIGRYGISGKQQKTPIGQLSDGLKSRVVFAMLALEKPNMLLFDEPTNHLDMDCIDALAVAINQFNGGMLLVSHDFRLISQVAKVIWVCDNKTVKVWPGTITSYKKSLLKHMKF